MPLSGLGALLDDEATGDHSLPGELSKVCHRGSMCPRQGCFRGHGHPLADVDPVGLECPET